MIARHSGKCLDVSRVSTKSGAQVWQWDDSGGDNQRWRIDALPGGGYTLTAKHSGLMLSTENNSTDRGALVQQATPQSCAMGSGQTASSQHSLSITQSAVVASGASGASTSATAGAAVAGRLMAYPNPANDFITVLLPNGVRPTEAVAIYDALGRLVPHAPLDGDGRLAVGQLPGGTYSLAVGQGTQRLRQRILVTHDGSATASSVTATAISAGQQQVVEKALALASVGVQTAALAQPAVSPSACPQGWLIEDINGTSAPVQPTLVAPVATPPDLAAYRQLAQNYSLASGMAYRYGDASGLSNTGFPTQYLPSDKHFDNHGNGNGWSYQVGGSQNSGQNDYSSNQAQVLYVADKTSNMGLDIVQQILMAEGTFSEKPQLPWVFYGGGHPDPNASIYAVANGGSLRQPTAIGRSYGFTGWGSNDLVAFQSGLIAAFGTNTSPGNVSLKLPANKVPTAVTMTSNNEFALVTVWDTDAGKGQVAVLALGTGNSYWGDWAAVYPGLRNRGLFTFIKLLGYVDLPGVTQPTEISASTDFAVSLAPGSGWMDAPDGSNDHYQEENLTLSSETNRQSFIGGLNKTRYSKAGFAVVISKAENKAVFLDLKPLFDQVRTMYFTTRDNFNQTQNLGQQPGQWPFAFSVTPNAAPVVVKTVTLGQAPTAVRTSLAPGVNQAYVATQDGTLHLFSVGGYGTSAGGTPAAIAEVGSVAVGSNPTSIAFVKDKAAAASTIGNQLMVAVRGERAIKWIKLNGTTASVFKTLRDTRLVDPVWVEDNDNHGTESSVVSVVDYTGKQIINYRYGPVAFHTNGGTTFGMGSNGQAEFECGGAYPVAGYPFQLSGNNVP